MVSKLLQRIGIVALIALIGGSFAALFVVHGRIHVTIAEEEAAAARGPDPIALLGADVATIHEDVRVLAEGVGTQMQTLHDSLESAAAERETKLAADVTELRRQLAALQSRLDQSVAESASSRNQIHQAITQLDQGIRNLAAAVSDGAARAVAIAPVQIPEIASSSQGSATAAAPVAPLEPAASPESAPKKNFLSFKLPSGGFKFDQRQRFAIVSTLSRVGFDAKSTLHDFSGVTTVIEGEIVVDPSQPDKDCRGAVSARASTLDTGLDARDKDMREILEPAKFPEIRFDWKSFESTSVDVAAQKLSGTAKGTLTIHGTAREIAIPVAVAVDSARRLTIDGQTKIKMSDFGVRPPNKLGVISVEDDVVLWIALRARTLGPAVEANR